MKRFITFIVFGWFLLGAHVFAQEKTARPPNLVIVLADDMGYGDPQCYNKDSLVPTPNIDRLARQGMRFTDAHTPSSVCTPTRYGLLTGRYCWRSPLKSGVLWGYSPILIEKGRLTLASLLKRAGYYTAMVGKWHLGLGTAPKVDYAKPLTPGPNTFGFDYFFGIPASLDMEPYVYVENDKVTQAPTEKTPGHGQPAYWRAGPIAPDFKHVEVHDKMTDKVVSIIGKQTAERPFLLYFALPGPHMPVLPNKDFAGKSKAGMYGDFVMQVDDGLGRVLKALDDTKLAENTLVIFTSDNGGYLPVANVAKFKHNPSGGLHGQKADIWEGGHRVPFVVRWPGKVEAGSVSKETICLTDIFATAASLAKLDIPENAGEDSFDLVPAFTQKNERPIRPATIHHSIDGSFAIRQGPWRFAPQRGSHGFSSPQNIKAKEGEALGELFNLETDLAEKENLWLKEPDRVARMVALLEQIKRAGRSRPK